MKIFQSNHRVTIYDQPNNESLNQKIEIIRYSAPLAITGAIKETFQSKLYNELGFESLKFRHWFDKIRRTGVSKYLFDLIPETNHIYILIRQIMLQLFKQD